MAAPAPGLVYVVEHMEEDYGEWCHLEYIHMIEGVRGSGHRVRFTNLPDDAAAKLRAAAPDADCGAASVHVPGTLPAGARVCLLDPKATEPLQPGDAALFDTFVFGGILGDDPPKYRTSELHSLGAATRHLGPVQMTTDTAVLVTHAVVGLGQPLDQLPYLDRPDVVLGPHESINLPFRYLTVPGPDGAPAPRLPRGMMEHLRDSMDEPLW